MVHAGAVLYLFLSIGDTGKFLSQNIASQVSSYSKLKLQLNCWVRTPLPTPLDVSWGANYATVTSSISLSKEA